MANIKVIVVDDSSFSRTILAETLKEGGCEVVGEADALDTLLDMYAKHKPDIVTMDIAMPGADGFECSKMLRLQDPEAKIILVSSMKDEETEAEARRIGIVGYVQKPVDAEDLMRVIKSVMAPDTLFENLEQWSMEIFKEVLAQNVTRMTKTPVEFADEQPTTCHVSQGISVVIGIIGHYSGRMIFDLSREAAEKMTELALRRPAKNKEEVLAMAAEFANIVAGVACSMLNKKEKALGLRVTPPSIFHGAPTEIISPNIHVRSILGNTDFGCIHMTIGFKKGSAALWM